MVRKVIYNGGTNSFYVCASPVVLQVGKEYEVASVIDKLFQTNYKLVGVEGEFNAEWFDGTLEDNITKNTYIAISHNFPEIGKPYRCTKVEIVNGKIELTNMKTSSVRKYIEMGDCIYEVTTGKSVYMVKIG